MASRGQQFEATNAAHRWGRWESAFESERDYANPVQEVALDLELVSPSGAIHRAGAFWDGGRTWRARFCPDEVGTWRYETHCSDRNDAGLHGRSGSFACVDYDGANPLF